MDAFSNRLRALRSENAEQQADVAKFLGVSPQSYSAYENGREPSYDLLIKLADHFGISIDYLLGRTNVMPMVAVKDVKELGLNEKNILLLKNGIPSFPGIDYPPHDKRTLADVLNAVLDDDMDFCTMLAFIRLATSPPSLPAKWGDAPPKLAVSPSRAERADYRQHAKEYLDKIIDAISPDYPDEASTLSSALIEKWSAEMMQKGDDDATT